MFAATAAYSGVLVVFLGDISNASGGGTDR